MDVPESIGRTTVIAHAVTPDVTRDLHVWTDVPSGVKHLVAYFVLAREDAPFTVSDGETTTVMDTTWWIFQMSETNDVIEEDAPYPSLEQALGEYPELNWQFTD